MDESKKVRLSGIAYESLVNGPGIRRVLFSQGCKHNCTGCFNPETHTSDGGKTFAMDELVEDIEKNTMLRGVTFSGGDPFEQADKFAYMAKKIKSLGKDIWCYTGYAYEDILTKLDNKPEWKELLENIDVLVDGKFQIDNREEGLRFRGSSNQRIIDIKKSLRNCEVVKVEYI